MERWKQYKKEENLLEDAENLTSGWWFSFQLDNVFKQKCFLAIYSKEILV